MQQINYYRQSNAQGYDESWQACQFNADTDLSAFTSSDLVSINGQPYIRQHHVTYLTGRETCRAHHFAKHLAIQVLANQSSDNNKVLWIDTIHGPHVSAAIYRELSAHAADKRQLHFLCLDILGSQRTDFYWLNPNIESLIQQFQPQLVVIDDIDHFMPHCGINIATAFCKAVRDITNHTETAFLFIGYNHLGNKASTTGNLGKYLFTAANDIFSLSTQREVTTVRHICGYDLSCDPNVSEFRFTIGNDNLPHEAATAVRYDKTTAISDDTLCDIVPTILQPDQAITPDEFTRQVNARHRQIKQHDRDSALLNQAIRLNLIEPATDDINNLKTIKLNNTFNNSLTHPHHQSTPPDKTVPCESNITKQHESIRKNKINSRN